MSVSHLKIFNTCILFHGTVWSHSILYTAKTCSVPICSKSISWVVRFLCSSCWNSLWLPAWGSSCSSLVLINQIPCKLTLVLCETVALTHVSDTYKVISDSFQSGMNSILTSVTHHDVPFRVVPLWFYAVALTILAVLQTLLQLTIGITYMVSDWSWISEIPSCEVHFYPYTEQRSQQNKSCK